MPDSILLPRPVSVSIPHAPGLHFPRLFGAARASVDGAANPFARCVNPHLADLLRKLWLDKQFVRGEGCELFDNEGRRYLDCISAYGALPFGFNPAEIWQSLQEVQNDAEPSFIQPSLLGAAGELAERLLEVAPVNMRHVTFTNSGAESIEAAIKLCRAATGRQGILSTHNSFHGKTLGALAATGNPDYQKEFCTPTGEFYAIPYGDADALAKELSQRPEHYAAFIVEPIQGEGGVVVPPRGYLARVREICSKAGVLLVFDEIQTGLGRTGAMFCCELEARATRRDDAGQGARWWVDADRRGAVQRRCLYGSVRVETLIYLCGQYARLPRGLVGFKPIDARPGISRAACRAVRGAAEAETTRAASEIPAAYRRGSRPRVVAWRAV